MRRYLFFLALFACRSDFEAGGNAGTGTGGGAPTTDSGSTSNGHHSSPSGSGSTDGSAGSTGSSTFGTSSSKSTPVTSSDDDAPYYSACDDVGSCPSPLTCVREGSSLGICTVGCEATADCPPAPGGQSPACLDAYDPLPGMECMIPCEGFEPGSYEQGSCPDGTVCFPHIPECGAACALDLCTYYRP